jgi:threonyl-tRNA synthetase
MARVFEQPEVPEIDPGAEPTPVHAGLDRDHDAHGHEDDPLYRRRHSLAHILAQAVLELRPGTQLGFGPPTEHGFYYDFLLSEPLTPADLPAIEERMRGIIKARQPFELRAMPAGEAIGHLEAIRQPLKVEYARDLAAKGVAEITFYKNGPFEDMCEGPHVESTAVIPADCFALDTLAGAYWRGDERRPMLTRIYGLAFKTGAALKEFKEQRRLALERDHRKLGRELELFTIADEIGPGLVMWLPNGAVLRDELERFAVETEFRQGYVRVHTPHVAREQLYLTSGHLPLYKESMYPPMVLEGESDYYLKPMNCPHHHIVFKSLQRSYRDLPLRLAEYGAVYRYELSGTLAGMLRVRGLTMNDAHIYCRPDQAREEFRAVLDLCAYYYDHFRIKDYWLRLSLHDPAGLGKKYLDDPEGWQKAESAVRDALREFGRPFVEAPGEAAFYGPKVDYQIRNVVGREETASTNQLDFGVPVRFDLKYKGEDGAMHRPLVIHRAPLSTHERMIAFLIEHFGGAFPTWMAPVQVRILPVAAVCEEFAGRLAAELRRRLFRAEVDAGPESFNKRLRTAAIQKVPNVLVIGQREVAAESVTWRRHAAQNDQRVVPVAALMAVLERLRADRVMDNFPDVAVEIA